MKRDIAFCGLDCESCETRIATMNNDNNMRERIAKKWSELNNVTILPSQINCLGCRSEKTRSPYCDFMCKIRPCALEKKLHSCAECDDIDKCKNLKQITDNTPTALDNLKGLCVNN